MNKIILSICIPTYNRADILDLSLSKLVKEPAFLHKKIEICISDNASTDHTKLIVQKYKDNHPNIIYHRNEFNTGIIDDNFPIVAGLATGTFIKFLNDYASFIPGELDKMLKLIELNEIEKPVLFFSNNNVLGNSNDIIVCDGINEFVKNASYLITWVLCAGFWREDLDNIDDRDRSISKFMWCPDNYLRLVSRKRKAIIYNSEFSNLQVLKSKGGYNPFKTFGVDYLSMYDDYLISGEIKKSVFWLEKYKLFRFYLLKLYIGYIIENNENTFDKSNAIIFLRYNYSKEPYFYFGIFWTNLRYKYMKRFL